jgi:hypothetical protein
MTPAENPENLKAETTSTPHQDISIPPQNGSKFHQLFWKIFRGRPNQQPTLLGHFLITTGLLILIGVG